MWNIIAKILAYAPIAQAIILNAENHVYGHIRGSDGSLYMGRWWVIKEHRWFPWAVRLHLINRPDHERDKHDHPCGYRTIVIMGGYMWEDLMRRLFGIFAGQTDAHPAEHFHRIIQVEACTYTLFIYNHKKKHNDWGFLCLVEGDIVKVPWRQYIEWKGLPPMEKKQ